MSDSLRSETIDLIQIEPDGRLLVRPRQTEFEFIYRSATGVHWDDEEHCLAAPPPQHWSHLRWFQQIVSAVVSEYGAQLTIDSATQWVDVPTELQDEIEVWLQA